MAIVSGYQKMKDYIKQSSGYKLLSRWANANTLECDDGKTLQNKVGGISGISSSLTANSTTQAASTNLTNQLYQNITSFNNELKFPDGTGFYPDIKNGIHGYNTDPERGADTFSPFSNYITGEAAWENINNQETKGYTYVDLGFRPQKLIGYTVDDTQASTLAVEVMYFNIWENDDIVHRRAVSRYYNYVMGDAPTRIVITDTGFTMYNEGMLWRWQPFRYVAFKV